MAGAEVSPSQSEAAEPDHPYLAGFLSQLRQERRLSRHTADAYARDVRALLELAGTTPLAELQIHQIRRFVAQLHGRGLGGKSLARLLSAWRGFFKYLARDHGLSRNPCTGVRAPKSPKPLPKALSPDEATRLVSIPGDDKLAVRDRAILELFYSSGLRLSELTSLKSGDVSFDGCYRARDWERQQDQSGAGRQPRIAGVESMDGCEGDAGETGCDRVVRQPARRRHNTAGDPAALEDVERQAGPFQPRASAHAAPLVRLACTAIQRRPARSAGNAGSLQHLHDAGVYAS